MKKIFKTYLIKRGACSDQVKLFQKLYPDGIHVCKDCFQDAQDEGLDVYWLPRFLQWTFWDRCQFYDNYTRMVSRKELLVRIVNKTGLAILEKALLEAPRPK